MHDRNPMGYLLRAGSRGPRSHGAAEPTDELPPSHRVPPPRSEKEGSISVLGLHTAGKMLHRNSRAAGTSGMGQSRRETARLNESAIPPTADSLAAATKMPPVCHLL